MVQFLDIRRGGLAIPEQEEGSPELRVDVAAIASRYDCNLSAQGFPSAFDAFLPSEAAPLR
jgi:hypothetical protein